jgi:lysosomal Pro-X carboxypeptidase
MSFNSYSPLNQSLELSSYLEGMYAYAAQYNAPPEYPVNMICNAIDQASHGNNIIDKIYSGVVALYGNDKCIIHHSTSKKDDGWVWHWQVYIYILIYNRCILLKQLNSMNYFLSMH